MLGEVLNQGDSDVHQQPGRSLEALEAAVAHEVAALLLFGGIICHVNSIEI